MQCARCLDLADPGSDPRITSRVCPSRWAKSEPFGHLSVGHVASSGFTGSPWGSAGLSARAATASGEAAAGRLLLIILIILIILLIIIILIILIILIMIMITIKVTQILLIIIIHPYTWCPFWYSTSNFVHRRLRLQSGKRNATDPLVKRPAAGGGSRNFRKPRATAKTDRASDRTLVLRATRSLAHPPARRRAGAGRTANRAQPIPALSPCWGSLPPHQDTSVFSKSPFSRGEVFGTLSTQNVISGCSL